MKKIILATGNAGKVREMRELLKDDDVLSMKEAGLFADVEETGATFAENARLKAAALKNRMRAAGIAGWAVADDSGLCVDALGGAPGVYSARFLGEDTPYPEKMRAIIERLASMPDCPRTARFISSIVCIHTEDNREFLCEGVVEGEIAAVPAGENGFGYDPIFYIPEKGRTMAELSETEKNEISHRGKAMRALQGILEKACI